MLALIADLFAAIVELIVFPRRLTRRRSPAVPQRTR